jgi:hypothetical protein
MAIIFLYHNYTTPKPQPSTLVNMTHSFTHESSRSSDATISEVDSLITSISTVVVDSSGPTGMMCDLTSQLAQTTLDPTPLNNRVAYYYALHLAEIPGNFPALSLVELMDPCVQ